MTKHDPGGKVTIQLPAGIEGNAVFGGPKGEYRYSLSRKWSAGPAVMFVMMNPSTADPCADDPTVAKCRRFATKWGYGSLYVGNTFAYRATHQSSLLNAADPVGPENDTYLLAMANMVEIVVFAYGKPKYTGLRQRGPAVVQLLSATGKEPHVLRLSKDGTPYHPLYLPENLQPIAWRP